MLAVNLTRRHRNYKQALLLHVACTRCCKYNATCFQLGLAQQTDSSFRFQLHPVLDRALFLALLHKCKSLSQTQWRSQPRIFWGGQKFDFRRITLFCLEKRLSKYKMTIFFKNLGGLRLWPNPVG